MRMDFRSVKVKGFTRLHFSPVVTMTITLNMVDFNNSYLDKIPLYCKLLNDFIHKEGECSTFIVCFGLLLNSPSTTQY